MSYFFPNLNLQIEIVVLLLLSKKCVIQITKKADIEFKICNWIYELKWIELDCFELSWWNEMKKVGEKTLQTINLSHTNVENKIVDELTIKQRKQLVWNENVCLWKTAKREREKNTMEIN